MSRQPTLSDLRAELSWLRRWSGRFLAKFQKGGNPRDWDNYVAIGTRAVEVKQEIRDGLDQERQQREIEQEAEVLARYPKNPESGLRVAYRKRFGIGLAEIDEQDPNWQDFKNGYMRERGFWGYGMRPGLYAYRKRYWGQRG